MAIRFRYDAAAVVPPSNQTTRKYGQNLVLQQNQQKYNAQQQGYDRLFTLGRDQQQATRQAIAQGQQNAANTIRDINQNANLVERQEAQNKFLTEQQQREQRAADFKAAQDRIGVYAQDALNNPDTPPEIKQKIRDLVGAKSTAMGSGFNETQQQEFLKDYNAQLAGHLSQIPPPKLKAPPQPNFHTDPNGNQWVESGPGKWAQVPQQPKPPTSGAEAFAADPRVQKDYMEQAIAIETKGGEEKLDEAGYARAVETARRLWERSNSPTEMPALPPAAPASSGTERSILERDQPAPPEAASPPGATQAAPQGPTMQPPSPPVITENTPTPPGKIKAYEAGGRGWHFRDQTPEERAASALQGTASPESGMPGQPPSPPIPGGQQVVGDAATEQTDPSWLTNLEKKVREPMAATKSSQSPSPITLESAQLAAKQYEGAAQTLQGLQAKVATLDQKIQAASGSRMASNNPDVLMNLKKQREQVNAELKSTQSAMQEADKSVRSYHEQQVAQQPAAQKLAKAGKRPQDFAEAEFQLQSLRKQYPDMASMPAEAKKKLKEAMAIIQAGR